MFETTINFSGGFTYKCLTYYNINGVEYGTANNLSFQDFKVENIQVDIQGNQLVFNKAIEGEVQIWSSKGQLLSTHHVLSKAKTIDLPNLPAVIYMVVLSDLNTVIKVGK